MRVFTRATKNFAVSRELLEEYHKVIGAEIKQRYLDSGAIKNKIPTWVPPLPGQYPPSSGIFVTIHEWTDEEQARKEVAEVTAKLEQYPHLRAYTSGPEVYIEND
jgi:hypothetical protein